MKRDEVLETASRFLGYITDHTRGLLLAVLAVLALVLVGVGVFAYFESRQERANEVFAEALLVLQADVVPVEANPDDPVSPSFASAESRDQRAQELFQRVQTDFGNTSVGRMAGVYLGKLALRRGDATTARELWESFLDSDVDHMLATEVRLNLLALDRADGRGEDVVNRLREQIGSPSPDLPEEISLDQLAITLEELGRVEEAREVYQRIIDEHPTSPYSQRAQRRLSTL
jgi:tetratricopeptide (TPR) repeat protein